MSSERLRVIVEISAWIRHRKYITWRLQTMYGSRWFFYIAKHPIRVTKQLIRYLDWCIEMDKHRILKDKYTRQV